MFSIFSFCLYSTVIYVVNKRLYLMRQSIRLSGTNIFFFVYFSSDLSKYCHKKISLEKQGEERFEESDPGEVCCKTISQIHLDHCRHELIVAVTV